MPSNHLILCRPLLPLPSIFASIRVFSNELVLRIGWPKYWSFQFSSVAQSCPINCDLMNHSTPGLPVQYKLPELTQTHAHRIGDAIQPSHPLSSPSPPAPNPFQHQGFSNESTLHMRWQKYWSFSFSISPSNEHPRLISFRMSRIRG